MVGLPGIHSVIFPILGFSLVQNRISNWYLSSVILVALVSSRKWHHCQKPFPLLCCMFTRSKALSEVPDDLNITLKDLQVNLQEPLNANPTLCTTSLKVIVWEPFWFLKCSESERHFFDVYCTSTKDASQSFNSIDIQEPTCFEINGEGLHNMSWSCVECYTTNMVFYCRSSY